MTEQQTMSEQQRSDWIKEHYQEATKYLASKGIITSVVAPEQSRYLVPLVAVWLLTDKDGNKFWVINGDLPADHVQSDVASNAREAMRHFSMKWQLQAENLIESNDQKQQEFGQLLIGRAEGLYQIFDNEDLWKEG